jgi:xylan 1,4-beta-xylosidase
MINKVFLSDEWENYGTGDPFVMKFNGYFYLYCSTKDDSIGIKCWTSTDCVHWTYEGLCSTDSITKTAYAPEVVYWNGTFYMYTSPDGNGHYVLTSSSPTGPFSPVTDNLGCTIDGSVFIEDDGSWYFFYAGTDGIHGAVMNSPTSIGNDQVLEGTQISRDWTEGPTLMKRNGIYYLTATGNHVLSKGYRVNLATNTTGPLKRYTASDFNPILLKTEGYKVGLGHSSCFIGPDLDTYYIVYHNLTGVVPQGWPLREVNFDAIGWNGDKMVVYGPTSWSMQSPSLPDFEDRFQRTRVGSGYSYPNGGTWGIINNFLYQNVKGSSAYYIACENSFITASDYTAEFNVQEVSKGEIEPKCGAVYGFIDENNYGFAVLNGNTNQLETNLLVNGVWGIQVNTSLPAGFDITMLHTIRIEKLGATYKYYVDNLWKETKITTSLGAGRIGYMSCDDVAYFGYIACSNKVNGSGIFDFYKPIPGTVQAVHYNSGEGAGYYAAKIGNTEGKYRTNDKVDIRNCSEGGKNIARAASGEWYQYNVCIEADGAYNLGLRYATPYHGCQVRVWLDSTAVTGVVNLPNTGGWNNWQTYTIKELDFTDGNHVIRLEAVTGEYDLYTYEFVKADNTSFNKIDNFNNSFSSDWNYEDGQWSIVNGTANINNVGKRTMGKSGWSDYIVECDIQGIDNLNSGIMVRVQNPARGGAGDDSGLGSDFYQGYFAGLSTVGVSLGKQNYSWITLASTPERYDTNTWYHMKVTVSGNTIKVYVGDMTKPKIDYTDNSNPFIHGKVGIRAHYANTNFDNFNVKQ